MGEKQKGDVKEERMFEGRGVVGKSELIQGSCVLLIINLFLSREKATESDLRISSHICLCYFKEASNLGEGALRLLPLILNT